VLWGDDMVMGKVGLQGQWLDDSRRLSSPRSAQVRNQANFGLLSFSLSEPLLPPSAPLTAATQASGFMLRPQSISSQQTKPLLVEEAVWNDRCSGITHAAEISGLVRDRETLDSKSRGSR